MVLATELGLGAVGLAGSPCSQAGVSPGRNWSWPWFGGDAYRSGDTVATFCHLLLLCSWLVCVWVCVHVCVSVCAWEKAALCPQIGSEPVGDRKLGDRPPPDGGWQEAALLKGFWKRQVPLAPCRLLPCLWKERLPLLFLTEKKTHKLPWCH